MSERLQRCLRFSWRAEAAVSRNISSRTMAARLQRMAQLPFVTAPLQVTRMGQTAVAVTLEPRYPAPRGRSGPEHLSGRDWYSELLHEPSGARRHL